MTTFDDCARNNRINKNDKARTQRRQTESMQTMRMKATLELAAVSMAMDNKEVETDRNTA